MINFLNLQKAHLLSDEINATLEAILLLAKTDITKLTNIVRHSTLSGDGGRSHTGALVKEIQGYDTFEQRCNHVMSVNAAVMERKQRYGFIKANRADVKNIYALNKMQFQHAWGDFHRSLVNIKDIAGSLFTISPLLYSGIYEADFITRRKALDMTIQSLSQKFDKMAEYTIEWEFSDVVYYRNELSRLYTSSAERSTVDKFDCRAFSSAEGIVNEEDSIDLFE